MTVPRETLTLSAHGHEAREAREKFERRPLDMAIVRRLFGYTRPYARTRNSLFLLVIVRSVQLPGMAWMLGYVIKEPVARGDLHGLATGVLGFLLLALSTQLVMHFRQRLALQLGEAVVHDLRNDLFAHLMRMPMAFYHRMRVGSIISRFTSDIESVRTGVQNVVFVSLVQAGQMLVCAFLMLYYDPVLFLVVCCIAPAIHLINRHFRGRLSDAHRATLESFSRVTATVAESVKGIKVTQGYARGGRNATLFHDLVTDHAAYNLRAATASSMFIPLLELNSQFFTAALVCVGGIRVLAHSDPMEIGNLIQFFFLAHLFFAPIQHLAQQYNQALTSMAGAERVFRLLDTPPDWSDPPDARPVPSLQGAVELRDVVFEYVPGRPALRGVSFRVEPGTMTALVGHTGSGKTSIINLVAKFYLATRGTVRVDGLDLRELRTADLHRHMGIVLQQNFLFTGTVLENIRIGRPGASDDDVRRAVQALDCLDVIGALPAGFQTRVGEDGAGLSLGQRQVICFARAMLADPRILILDEATSSVDVVTESRIQKALETLCRGRTSFVVAHRLSTIRNAHLVLVLENGVIVERGTHRELLLARGRYAQLYRRFMVASRLEAALPPTGA